MVLEHTTDTEKSKFEKQNRLAFFREADSKLRWRLKNMKIVASTSKIVSSMKCYLSFHLNMLPLLDIPAYMLFLHLRVISSIVLYSCLHLYPEYRNHISSHLEATKYPFYLLKPKYFRLPSWTSPEIPHKNPSKHF